MAYGRWEGNFLETNQKQKMRIIKTNPGIGDSLWVIQKLINTGEKFHWQIHDGNPQRGKQVFDLLPQVTASCEYKPGLHYSVIKPNNIARYTNAWSGIQQQDFYLSANEHLEAGRRIDNFLPDLPTSYELPFQTQAWEAEVKERYTNGPYIGIYASAYSTARNWGFWQEDGWLKLIRLVNNLIPAATFVLIGAEWDAELAGNLRSLLQRHHISYISTIGQPLGFVIEMMKRLDYGFYFPSGLGVLSGLLHRPSVMFYPPALPKLACTWADPVIIEDGSFKECQFTTPEKIFTWVKDVYKLDKKI
jgi:ADP-heptose:LPS heptosyltransferase